MWKLAPITRPGAATRVRGRVAGARKPSCYALVQIPTSASLPFRNLSISHDPAPLRPHDPSPPPAPDKRPHYPSPVPALSNSLIDVFARVFSSTRLTITAAYRLCEPSAAGSVPET